MSKSTDEFKVIMETDRGERAKYEAADPHDIIRVPITRDGFEALLARACSYMQIPLTNPLRNVFVGFLHHIGNEKCETSISDVGASLLKSMSNHCSWQIDQEIKKAANEELREEQAKMQAAILLKKQQDKDQRLLEAKSKADLKKTRKSASLNGKA